MYFNLYSKQPICMVCMHYIEIPPEVTNKSAITLVYYLAQQKL